MIAADVIFELGDPDKVCGSEDHIVLKLDKPWSPYKKSASAQLPRGLHLEDRGKLIRTTTESFIANQRILCKLRVDAALFAGCAAFRSCKSLASAARKVLAQANTLVIVHNRDYVVNLVDWFRSVEVLVLHHDLKLQTLPKSWDKPPSLSQLKRLIGSTAAIGMDHLYLPPDTIYALVYCCTHLSEVQAPMHDIVAMSNFIYGVQLESNTPLLTSPSLVLGMSMERLDGATYSPQGNDITLEEMMTARALFPGIRRLEVTTDRLETMSLIERFTEVTDLSLASRGGTVIPFPILLESALMHLHLKHLSLKFVTFVNLSAIARTCPDLESLSLVLSSFTAGEQEMPPISLPNLVNLRLSFCREEGEVCEGVMNALLKATTKLEILRLDGAALCASFLIRCNKEHFPSLQRLTLGTDKHLPALGLTGDDLRCLVEALPSLRYAATDSYDLRLFFLNYMPLVTIDWCHCTTCAAEFPRIDKDHEVVWNSINRPA